MIMRGSPSRSRSMRAVALAMALCRAKALAPAAPLGATSRGAALRATVETATTAAPPTTDLVAKTRAFLESGTGFYSAPDASMLADDFIFRGGVVGPLNKADYLDTMEKLGVYRAFDLDANAYGFVEDPRDPRCVRFFLRNTGEHVDAWQPWGNVPPLPIRPAAGRTAVRGPTETGRLVFDDAGRVRHFATGLVVGKCEPARGDCNTSGLGAVLGLFHAVGFGWVGNLALIGGFRKLANVLAASLDPSVPKTKSEADVVPAWWIE